MLTACSMMWGQIPIGAPEWPRMQHARSEGHTNGALGNRVEIVIVRRTHFGVNANFSSKRIKELRLERAFVVRADHGNRGFRERFAVSIGTHIDH